MAYRWTFGKDSLKLEKILWAIHNYNTINYGVTMNLQKKLFSEPGKSFPHWLKITFWNELGRLA